MSVSQAFKTGSRILMTVYLVPKKHPADNVQMSALTKVQISHLDHYRTFGNMCPLESNLFC